MLLTYTAFHPCMTCIGNIDQMLVKMTTESKKTPNLSRNFEEKKSLFRLLLLANTFYGCLFKTSNQIENGTIDFLFKMHLVWSLEVPKNQKCLEKVTQFSENFVFFRHFILMFLSYFWTKLRKKNHLFYKNFMFYPFPMHRNWFGAPKNLHSKSNFGDGPEKSWPSTWHCLVCIK